MELFLCVFITDMYRPYKVCEMLHVLLLVLLVFGLTKCCGKNL